MGPSGIARDGKIKSQIFDGGAAGGPGIDEPVKFVHFPWDPRNGKLFCDRSKKFSFADEFYPDVVEESPYMGQGDGKRDGSGSIFPGSEKYFTVLVADFNFNKALSRC